MAIIGKSPGGNTKSGSGGTTNVTVTPTPSQEGVLKVLTFEKYADFTIPAGANHVKLYHNDATGGDITVNGRTLQYRDTAEYDSKPDTTTNPPTLDRVPALAVVTGGKRVEVSVEYPSTSAVDPSTI